MSQKKSQKLSFLEKKMAETLPSVSSPLKYRYRGCLEIKVHRLKSLLKYCSEIKESSEILFRD